MEAKGKSHGKEEDQMHVSCQAHKNDQEESEVT
jgi:hypothetical protein